MQGLCLTLSLIWTAIYFLFSDFWNALFSLTTVQMIAMLIMVWMTSVFTFWAQEQRVNLNYKTLVFVTILVSVLKPLLGVIFVILANDKVTARILSIALVEIMCYSSLFYMQMNRGKVFYSSKYWFYALRLNIPLVPHYLSMTILDSSDRIMIKEMVGPAEAGLYSLAYSISQIMLIFNQSLLQTITPWIYKKIKTGIIDEIADVSYITLVFIAGINIILIALAPEAVAFFAPKSYYDAIWVIPPVAMSVFFVFAYNLFASFEFYYEKNKFIAIASISGAIVNLLLNYIFIPCFGAYAAGYTTLFCYLFFALGHYIFMNKTLAVYLNGRHIFDKFILIKICITFIACGFLLLLTYNSPNIRFFIVVVGIGSLFVKRKKICQNAKLLLNIRHQKNKRLV